MSDKKILLLVDHKHRDLPPLALIGFCLTQLGCQVKLRGLEDEDEIIKEFDPLVIVLPKPIYNFRKLVHWKIQGRRLVVIDTEGNSQFKSYKFNILIEPDIYFFWNSVMKDRYNDILDNRKTIKKVLGFPRSDFLHSNYLDLFPSRADLLNKYGLNHNNKTITIATSTQDCHFSKERIQKKSKRRSRALSESEDYREIVKNKFKLLSVTLDMLEQLSNKYPDINIAVKPHPHENVVFWQDFIDKLNNPNIKLVAGEPIYHLLLISDLHVSHNVCTTTIEAIMAGVKAVEIHTDKSRTLYDERHLYIADYIIRKADQMISISQKELFSAANDDELEGIRNHCDIDSYISKYFYKFDGGRCQEYAEELNSFMKNQYRKVDVIKFIRNHYNCLLPYCLATIKYTILNALMLFQRNRRLEREVNAPSAVNEREVKEINGVLVDAEYGLFDNRMRPGDESIWYQRFSGHKYTANYLVKNIE